MMWFESWKIKKSNDGLIKTLIDLNAKKNIKTIVPEKENIIQDQKQAA